MKENGAGGRTPLRLGMLGLANYIAAHMESIVRNPTACKLAPTLPLVPTPASEVPF